MSSLGSLFSAPQISTPQNFTPPGFVSQGLSGSYSGGAYSIMPSANMQSQVGQLQRTFGQAATAFGNLGKTVAPGFSLFRQAGLQDIANQQQSTMSTLQNNLAQRRVLGSSFAQNSLSQTAADFEKQRTDFIAQTYLQELQASNQLTQEQFQAAASKWQVGIQQMNLEAGIAADLTGKAMQSMTSIAEAQAQLDAQNAAGIGSLFGTLGAAGIGALGKYGAASALSGGGGAAAAGGASAFDVGASALPFLALA